MSRMIHKTRLQTFCVRDRVMLPSGRQGVVIGPARDGRIRVRYANERLRGPGAVVDLQPSLLRHLGDDYDSRR